MQLTNRSLDPQSAEVQSAIHMIPNVGEVTINSNTDRVLGVLLALSITSWWQCGYPESPWELGGLRRAVCQPAKAQHSHRMS